MNLGEIKSHQQVFLKKQKARTEPTSYVIEVVKITVNPGVFPPATDTKLLASHIKVSNGIRILDLTTGSGISSIIAGLQGTTGIAVDINPKAIENAKESFLSYGVKIDAILSNLFEKVPIEQFDQIYVNGPFIEGEIKDPLDYSCYGAREFMNNFLTNLKAYLKPGGKALIVLAEWSDLEYFRELVEVNDLKVSLIDTRTSDDSKRNYNLYEVKY